MVKKARLEEYLISQGFQIENDLILSPLFLKTRKNEVQMQLVKNGKVDFEFLQKELMIVKPKIYIEREFKDEMEDLVFLSQSCINNSELERILVSIKDELNRTGFCDIEHHINYTLKLVDMTLIFDIIKKKLIEKNMECIQQNSLILSEKFLSKKKVSTPFNIKIK
jgi:hypothetical protein